MKRFYIETEYREENGRDMTDVFEYKVNENEIRVSKPRKIATFTHEWRACKFIDKLILSGREVEREKLSTLASEYGGTLAE